MPGSTVRVNPTDSDTGTVDRDPSVKYRGLAPQVLNRRLPTKNRKFWRAQEKHKKLGIFHDKSRFYLNNPNIAATRTPDPLGACW